MNLPFLRLGCRLLAATTLASAVPVLALAAGTPTQQEMIDALSPPMRTRGLRNLKVVEVPASSASEAADSAPTAAVAPAAPEAPPSLSLAINFDFNSATIRPDSAQALSNLAGAMKSPQLQKSHFLIEGHTDAKGGADYNLRLSNLRAQAVKARLVQLGVEPRTLDAVGRGSTQLAEPGEPLSPANRRVRIVAVQ